MTEMPQVDQPLQGDLTRIVFSTTSIEALHPVSVESSLIEMKKTY
jgi:hypothetical protein